MKAQFNAVSLLCISALLTGCGIEPALSGKARGEYLRSIKPFIEWWDKPGMTAEARRRDSFDCGGGASETHAPSFSKEQLNAVRLAGDRNDFAPSTRLFHEWERCMLRKGYRFTGKCYDNEVSRTSPACGAL